ncbi:MAG: CDP-glycerol glycerophosphotransferase family protein [Candidatus Moraniibacteriota bacterium]
MIDRPFSDLESNQPNPQARIGLIIFYPFQYYVLKDIYEQLSTEAEFIIDLGAFYPVRNNSRLLRQIQGLLDSKNVRYRILQYENYHSYEYLEQFFSHYEGLVALWERGCMSHKATNGIPKIGVTYGSGKELNSVRPSRGLYDLILSYGPRDHELFSFYTRSEIVGNPKFDDWFSGKIDTSVLEEVQSKLDLSKRTVLYLPTHSDLSSVEHLAAGLKSLTQQYNVVVKLHYFLVYEEPERVALLKGGGLITYEDAADILPLLKVADVVVSDNSSAIFDAILADRPVVVADFLSPGYLDGEHQERKQYRRGSAGPVTFSGSIEQEIKRDGRVITFSDPADMRSRVAEALEDKEFYRQERRKLVAELFSYNDGKCGERAAKRILECIADSSPKERPILYHAIEAYKTRIGVGSYAYRYDMEGRLAAYRHRLVELGREKDKLPIFCVIVVDMGEGLSETLSSVVWQEYPLDRYEVVVMSPQPNLGDVCTYATARSPLKAGVRIRFEFYPGGGAISDRLAAVIASSDAEWVGFTRSGCAPGSDWLMRYMLQIAGSSSIVGIGGHEMLTPETVNNRFMRYEYCQIAKTLGTHMSLRRYTWVTTVINSLPLINPFGSLSNSFYRREVLLEIDITGFGARSWSIIETLLRWLVAKYGGLAFVPIGVRRFIGPSHVSFKGDSFDRGFAHGLIGTARGEVLNRFSPHEGIQLILGDTISALSGRHGRRTLGLVATAFQAACFRWAGFLVARYQVLVGRQGDVPH